MRRQIVELLPRLRRFARTIARNVHDADDLVQLAIERALLKYDQWRPELKFDGWMFGIMRNAWIDEVRSRARRDRIFAPEEAGVTVGHDGSESQVRLLAVQRAVADLPEEQRLAVALVLVEGLSYKEAADVLEVPIGTLTSRLARGREALQAAPERSSRRAIMKFPPETLMAYADGELDVETRRAIEAEMAVDPQVAQEVERHRAMRAEVGGAFAGVLDEPVPDRLLRAAKKAAREPKRRADGSRARQWSWPEWTSIAASLLIGVLAGRAMLQPDRANADHRGRSGRARHRRRRAGAGAFGAAQLAGRHRRRHRAELPREVRRVLPHLRRARLEPGGRLRVPRCRGLAHRHAFDRHLVRNPAATIEWRAHSCRRPSSRPSRSGCRARRSMPTKKPSRASAAGGTSPAKVTPFDGVQNSTALTETKAACEPRRRFRKRWIAWALLGLWAGVGVWNITKPMPAGTNVSTAPALVPAADVQFLYDLTRAQPQRPAS